LKSRYPIWAVAASEMVVVKVRENLGGYDSIDVAQEENAESVCYCYRLEGN
jgi:hypothetical protein